MGMILYFLFTLFVSTGISLVVVTMPGENSFFLFCVAIGVWVPFIWAVNRREKAARRRRERERMLDEWLRSQTKNRY